ncbi:MAG: hypothetical protein Q8P20_07900 [bacterium]|nr:hypothetical protein [bacterium]
MALTKTKPGTTTILAIWASIALGIGALSQFGVFGGIETIAIQILSFATTFLGSALVFNEFGRGNIFKNFGRRNAIFISLIAVALVADVVIKIFAITGSTLPFFSGFAGVIDGIISLMAIIGIFT